MEKTVDERFSREQSLIGKAAMDKLKTAHVAIFGLGGVGSYAAEAIFRAGVGEVTLVDNDTVSLSNINRQLIALESTIGSKKTDCVASRAKEINPSVKLHLYDVFFDEQTVTGFDFSAFDYVIDAIDSVASKVLLIVTSKAAGVPIISAMGTGNKLQAGLLRIDDISNTQYCPLARVVRTRLRKIGIDSLKTVFSPEQPQKCEDSDVPASISFVPPVAGMLIAGEVIRELIK